MSVDTYARLSDIGDACQLIERCPHTTFGVPADTSLVTRSRCSWCSSLLSYLSSFYIREPPEEPRRTSQRVADSGRFRYHLVMTGLHGGAATRAVVSARHARLTFDEADLLFGDADVEHVRLASGNKDELEMLEVSFSGVTLEVGRHSWPVSTKGSAFGERTTFVVHQQPSQPGLIGDVVADSRIQVLGPHAELLNTSSAGTLYHVLSIDTEEMGAAARTLGHDRESLGRGQELWFSGPSADRICRLISSFTRTVYQAGSDGVDISVAKRFHDDALTSSLSVIGTNRSDYGQLRMTRRASLEIVIASDDYASRQRYRAITSLDLSREAFASERRVRYAFNEITGVPPMRFMRLRALNEIRKELRTGTSSSVTDVAFEWGFTELGRFAAAYRKLFGELPSETLRSSRHHFKQTMGRLS